MNWQRIRTIFTKDLRDAIRDGRVLVAIVVPIGLGVFYGLAIDDDDLTRESVEAAYAVAGQSTLPDVLQAITAADVDLSLQRLDSAAAVEALVRDGEVDIGFAVPAGFDEAARAGEQPPLAVYLPSESSFGTRYVAAALEPAARVVAGQQPPARIETSSPLRADADESVVERLGPRSYMVLGSVMLLVVMIAMLVVPVVLAEEAEKKTLDALVLIASYSEVIAAKALFGIAYIVLALAVQLAVTRLGIDDRAGFAATLTLLSVTVIGFGLLIGSIFKNANQLNTWGGFLLVPVLLPVFIVGTPVPDTIETLLQFFPTSAGMRLAVNSVAGEAIFADAWLSYLVIAAWGVVAYLVVAWQLNRRQA
jgi:ABC-2 type transport system permease protein